MTNSKTALITGITGQDGAYLAKLLLEKGYRVVGTYRQTSSVSFWRIEELGVAKHPALELVEHDLLDLDSCRNVLEQFHPREIYNLAAQSFVGLSFDQPVSTGQVTGLGVVNMLEALRIVDHAMRFYQASTSEMFGEAQVAPQDESTPFYPRSPYAVAKLYGHWMTITYRESYDIFGACGILFNHESPLRGREFVTRKITDSVARIHLNRLGVLELGNLSAARDWGFAGDYVDGMWRMMQKPISDTYVLATGRTETVRDFVSLAFKVVDRDVVWEGEGEQENGRDARSGELLVKVNPGFFRIAEVEKVIGNADKARGELNWEPQTTLEQLCQMMVESDLRRVSDGQS